MNRDRSLLSDARRGRPRRRRAASLSVAAALAVGGTCTFGAASPALAQNTDAVPAAPTNVVAQAGDRSAYVTWTAPAGTVKRYRVTELTTGKTEASTNPAVAMSGLPEGVRLRFVVEAINFAGTSPKSRPSAGITLLPLLQVGAQLSEGLLPGHAAITVRLNRVATKDVTVKVRTTDTGTATPGEDFVPIDTRVVVPAGRTWAKVPLELVDDDVEEPLESVGVVATAAGARQDPSGEVDIVDDDPGVSLTVLGAAPVTEGDSGTAPMRFTLRLSKPAPAPVTVLVTTVLEDPGTRVPDLRLTDPVQVITIPQGESSAPVVMGVRGNRRHDEAQTVRVYAQVLSGPARPVEGTNDGVVLADADPTTTSGADVAVLWPVPSSTTGTFTRAVEVLNGSTVDATGVQVVVRAHGMPGLPLATMLDHITPDPACTAGTPYVEPFDAVVAWASWTCPIGTVAAGGSADLHFTVVSPEGDNQVINWTATVTTDPMDDPFLGNNLDTAYP